MFLLLIRTLVTVLGPNLDFIYRGFLFPNKAPFPVIGVRTSRYLFGYHNSTKTVVYYLKAIFKPYLCFPFLVNILFLSLCVRNFFIIMLLHVTKMGHMLIELLKSI